MGMSQQHLDHKGVSYERCKEHKLIEDSYEGQQL